MSGSLLNLPISPISRRDSVNRSHLTYSTNYYAVHTLKHSLYPQGTVTAPFFSQNYPAWPHLRLLLNRQIASSQSTPSVPTSSQFSSSPTTSPLSTQQLHPNFRHKYQPSRRISSHNLHTLSTTIAVSATTCLILWCSPSSPSSISLEPHDILPPKNMRLQVGF